MMEQVPIDAVISWVDNADFKHQQKMFSYLPESEANFRNEFKKRFIEVEEIKYVVLSILKYAPFIRKIFIVTDQQIPKFIKSDNKGVYSNVEIIDHKDIFGADASMLPVFNSRSIETKLHQTPNLSEHFIYFNDDIFLLKPVKQSDFFVDGEPVVRGKWKRFKENILFKKSSSDQNSKRPKHGIAQEKSAKIIGFKRLFKFQHTPIPMRRSTLLDFFNENRELELKNIKHKFRSREQFLVQGIANHLEIRNKTCKILHNYQLVSFTTYNRSFLSIYFKFKCLFLRRNKLFLNIQELNLYKKSNQEFVLNWLEEKYKLNA